jgi:hypothetical protein
LTQALPVFQTFQRYVVVFLYGCCTCCICCKCFGDILEEFVQNISSIPDVCCKCFDPEVAYVSHICCNNSIFQMLHLFQSSVAASVFMLQVVSVISGCCICFHTYVESVCFKYFIYFRRILHSSVSCCTCFVFFGESGGAGK